LSNWKLFNRLKGKEDVPTEIEKTTEHIGELKEKQKISKIKEELEEVSIIVYNETLYSKGFVEKNPAIMLLEKKQQLKRLSWESLGTIERYVDDMECTQTELMGDKTQISNNIDQKVDCILSKKNVRL
jgi:predicted RNA-binding protein with EMAP domain